MNEADYQDTLEAIRKALDSFVQDIDLSDAHRFWSKLNEQGYVIERVR